MGFYDIEQAYPLVAVLPQLFTYGFTVLTEAIYVRSTAVQI
jgi:hypothetical protein